jgi:bifunctional non-homologous end joining protein LigD
MAAAVPFESLPRFLLPMLLTSGTPPEEADWAVEVKWDGMRAQVRYDGHALCVRSRAGSLKAKGG